MASITLLDLPPEILLTICDVLTLNNDTAHLEGAGMRSLVFLSQTCTSLHNLVQPLLYRTLTFTPSFPSHPFALHHLVGTLASPTTTIPNPHISSIHIFSTPSRPDLISPHIPFARPYSAASLPATLTTTLTTLLARFPLPSPNPDWRNPADWFLAQRALLGLLLCLASPTLRTVTFTKQWQDCHLDFNLPVPLPRLREVRVRKHEAFTGRWCDVDDTRALEVMDARALLGERVERVGLRDCYGAGDGGGGRESVKGWEGLRDLRLGKCVIDAAALTSLIATARCLRTLAFVDGQNLNCCACGDHADQILPHEIANALGGARETLQSLEVDLSHTLWHYGKTGQPFEQPVHPSRFSLPVLKELAINHSSVWRSNSRYLLDLVSRCPRLESLTLTRIRWIEVEAVHELACAVRSGRLPMFRRVVLVGYRCLERSGIYDDEEPTYCPGGSYRILQEPLASAGVSLSWRTYPAPYDSDQEQRL